MLHIFLRVFLLMSLVCTHPAAGNELTSTSLPSGGGREKSRTVNTEAATRPIPLKIKLPFPAGESYEVIQSNHGTYTHTGFNRYAWDFLMPENSPVCAAAAGRVVRVKQDGTAGGPSNRYFSDGNAIIIDHGLGYFSQYLHLAPRSARVKEGERVSGGQIIALSGNTGYTSIPHLHFHVQNASGQTLPATFQDVPGDGVPPQGAIVSSANDGTGTSQYTGESFLPSDIFSNNAITLISRNLPGHLYRAGREYKIKGRISKKDIRQVAVFFMKSTGGTALHTILAKVDAEGFFEMSFDPAELKPKMPGWNQSTTQSNQFSLAIAPVNSDGSFWSDVSVPVCVR